MRDLFTTISRTLQVLGPERRWRWLVLVGLAVAVAGFEAVGAVLILVLLQFAASPSGDVVVPVLGDLTTAFPGADRETVLLAVAGFIAAFFVVRGTALVGQAYVQLRMVHNAAARLSAHLLRGYLALPYLFHTTRNSAELVRNTFDTASMLAVHVMIPLVKVVSQSILVVGLAVVLVVTSPGSTVLVLVVLGPLIWLLLRIIHPRLARLGRRSQEAREGSILAAQQALGGIRDIRLLGKEHAFAKAFAAQRRKMAHASYAHGTMIEAPRALIETSLVLVIVLLFVAALVVGDSLGGVISTVGVFAYVGLRLQPSLRDIVKGINDTKFGAAFLDDLAADRGRVDAALDLERRSRAVPVPATGFAHRVELRGVGFAYAPDAPPVLAGVDLVVRKGEFVGICGPTGGGKSTLVDLIAGLLPPTDGRVQVDGRDLAEVTGWWQAQLGVVSQAVFLVDDTVRRNIALGDTDGEVDEERLARAVQRAQLGQVVSELPMGLDTLVGERGIRLSGGQRQRVAIARAFYREPAVLILDEGTSALDTATEAALVAAIDELKEGRTLVAVAHRISTVRRADRIVVVEAGRVAAQGSYDELLERSHLFRSLTQ